MYEEKKKQNIQIMKATKFLSALRNITNSFAKSVEENIQMFMKA